MSVSIRVSFLITPIHCITQTEEPKFSPPQMKEVSFPTPYTLFPVSPNEKIFTTTDERGFFPYTPHPFGLGC